MLDRFLVTDIIKNALIEDMNAGDLSSNLIDENLMGTAIIGAKENGMISGIDIVKETFRIIDETLNVTSLKKDGENVHKGEEIIIIKGRVISILKGERVALNFLQRMSGIASKSNTYAKKVFKYKTKVVDTRKTAPGLRILEKYSVRLGGCFNHRYSLSDGVMIKDNHIKALGGIKNAVEKAKDLVPHTAKIEVEVSNLTEVEEAVSSNADIIMLDNMSLDNMEKAIKIINNKCIIEASGNITLDNIEDIAKIGVDIISVGELTHSYKSLDISLNLKG